MSTRPVAFRFSDDVLARLDYLCSVTGDSRTSLLAGMVNAQYDKLQGNPELQKLLVQMKEMEKQMQAMM